MANILTDHGRKYWVLRTVLIVTWPIVLTLVYCVFALTRMTVIGTMVECDKVDGSPCIVAYSVQGATYQGQTQFTPVLVPSRGEMFPIWVDRDNPSSPVIAGWRPFATCLLLLLGLSILWILVENVFENLSQPIRKRNVD